MTNPYQAPSGRVADPPGSEFHWSAVLAGGLVALGIFYAEWLTVGMAFQHWYAAQGVELGRLNSTLAQSTVFVLIMQSLKAFGIAAGAVTAAKLAGNRPYAHSLATALVAYVALVLTYVAVYSPPYPMWSKVISLVSPVPSALLGAWWYSRRGINAQIH